MHRHDLNRDWRFHRGDPPRFSLMRTAVDWRELDLPHDWSIEVGRDPDNPCGENGGYFTNGRGKYQKTFTPASEWQGKVVMIEFEGVYMNAEVTLNGHYLGRHPYGYTSFHHDLTPYLLWDQPNVLTVVVDNSNEPNSRWYAGSGIYRPVWLRVGGAVHLLPWGVYVATSEIDADSATVVVASQVKNETAQSQRVTVRSRVVDAEGTQVGMAETSAEIAPDSLLKFDQSVQVAEPRLWSPESPSLYTLETEVQVDGVVSDADTTTFGIRELHFSAEKGFLLNGVPVLLKGGCVHHDNGILGAASYARSEERKVELLKASGYNAVRCAHNPPAPAFLDACDRLGMLVIDEAFDCWREGKTPGDYHLVFDDWWQRDLDSMLDRDRNHPSIIVWSIGNEIPERGGRGGGIETSRTLAEHVRSVDPTRPVMAAFNYEIVPESIPPDLNLESPTDWLMAYPRLRRVGWENMDASFATLDIGAYNYEWRQYRGDHERVPARVMMGTESFPAEAFGNWQSVAELPYVIGDFVWTSLDYLGEAGIGRVRSPDAAPSFLGSYPWHHANCGDLDLCGFKRPQSYYRDMLWHDDPRIYTAVLPPYPEGKTPMAGMWSWEDVWPNWNWAGHEGQVFKVDVYANCNEVELFLNGQSLGRKPCGPAEEHRAAYEVPYAPGKLEAVGYREGEEAAKQLIQTTGAPSQLSLTPDRDAIRAGGDLAYVTVEVLDAASLLHPAADNKVGFAIEGPGMILAVGNSDPTSEESYVGSQRRVHRGRALVVVKSSGESGEIVLHAQADGLGHTETVIRVS